MPIIILNLFFVVLGLFIGYATRLVLPYLMPHRPVQGNNINFQDRFMRFVFGIVALALGWYWQSALLLIFAGFSFYQAFAQWCFFFAIMGKNSCSI